MKLVIINGPNLNLLGKREPGIYGNTTFEKYFEELKSKFDVELEYYQNNSEGSLVDKIQEAGFSANGIIINAGAYTHTSVALADAIRAIDAPVIEVHISNTAAREAFRHNSFISPVCLGTITGFGFNSYELAIRALIMKGE